MGTMQASITTHYSGTTNGVISDGSVLGGEFYPEGPGVLAEVLDFTFGGRLKFDTDTGAPIGVTLAAWAGEQCGVQIVERSGGNGTRVVPCLWISATDRDGITHTREFPCEPGEYAFGFLSVAVA